MEIKKMEKPMLPIYRPALEIAVVLRISVVQRRVALKGRHYSCFKRNILECVEESKISTELVLQMTSGDWNVEDDYRLKQWAKCLLVRSNMMSKGGVFQLDEALALVPKRDKAAVETLIDQCLFTSPQAPEDTAWYFLKCYHINNPSYRYL